MTRSLTPGGARPPISRYQRSSFFKAHSTPPGPAPTREAYSASRGPRSCGGVAATSRAGTSPEQLRRVSAAGPGHLAAGPSPGPRQNDAAASRVAPSDRAVGPRAPRAGSRRAGLACPRSIGGYGACPRAAEPRRHTRVVTPLQGHPPLQRLYISRPRLRLDGQLGGAYQQHASHAVIAWSPERHLESPGHGRATAPGLARSAPRCAASLIRRPAECPRTQFEPTTEEAR